MNELKNLIDQRNNSVSRLENERKEIEQAEEFTFDYKQEQMSELDKQIKDMREKFEPDIMKSFEEKQLEYQSVHDNSDFNLTDEEVNRELLKRMKINDKTDELVEAYQNVEGSYLKNELVNKAKELMKTNSPYVESYIKAMKKLGVNVAHIHNLQEEYKEQNLTKEQKKANESLTQLEELKRDFMYEVDNEPIEHVMTGRFAEIMDKYQ